jgi:hypothetical protein
VKKPKLVMAALMLLIGAASLAGSKLWAGSEPHGDNAMLMMKSVKRGS